MKQAVKSVVKKVPGAVWLYKALKTPPPAPVKKVANVERKLAQQRLEAATMLEMSGEFEAALAEYEKVAGVHGKRGVARCLYELGEVKQAATLLRDADHFDKDMIPILYGLGNIEAAHRSYRYRATSELIATQFDQLIRPSKLSIRTDNKHRKGLMLAEGGPGDEIRISAIYEEIAVHFDELTVTCSPDLQGLLSRSMPSVNFLPVKRYRSEELIAASPPDRELVDRRLKVFVNDSVLEQATSSMVFSTLDALGEFRQRRSDFRRSPHLRADAERVADTRSMMGSRNRPQIGLSWRSMRQSLLRNRHYLATAELAPLAGLDADFWLLQIDATDIELEQLRSFLTLNEVDGLDLKDDFEGQAALITSLDAVVSPLTTTAELAGSLGAPTFIAAPDRSTEWRCNDCGGDVWYGNARTFSSKNAGGRHNVMGAIAHAIQKAGKR